MSAKPSSGEAMLAGLKPYPQMKDSGVEWLGEVPKHWDVCRLKRICRLEYGDSLANDSRIPGEIPVYGSNGIVGHHNRANTIAPCIVVGRKGSFGKVNYCGEPAFAIDTTFFVDARFSRADIRWLYHMLGWLRLDAVTKDSAIPGLDREEAYQRLAPLPVHAEQSSIARFLDHAASRIERYIRAKEKLIALLEEQKQVMVHDAVTGRIDVRTGKPYPAYKPSGVEWLGDVPANWMMSRVKGEFECLNHRRLPLSGTERGAMTLRQYDYYGASGVIDKVDDYLFDDDLVLIAEDGANLVLRNLPLAIIARGKFWVNNHAHILKPRTGRLEYLAALMESLDYLPWISGAAQPKLTQDRLMSIAIAVPARDEQDAIASYLLEQTKLIRIGIARAQREIDLFREYRTGLIANVVTGKLDVREAATALPSGAYT